VHESGSICRAVATPENNSTLESSASEFQCFKSCNCLRAHRWVSPTPGTVGNAAAHNNFGLQRTRWLQREQLETRNVRFESRIILMVINYRLRPESGSICHPPVPVESRNKRFESRNVWKSNDDRNLRIINMLAESGLASLPGGVPRTPAGEVPAGTRTLAFTCQPIQPSRRPSGERRRLHFK
jgi:hypothetical protein